ncbi:MAG: UMP kinase [Pseudomonadota bacterium]
MADSSPRYLLKLSGEALAGPQGFGHDAATMKRIAGEIADCANKGTQIAIVVGGGNIIRGARMAAEGGDRVAGDHMGMLGTLINGIAMREAIREAGASSNLFSGFPAPTMCETFSQRAVLASLSAGEVVVLAGGTGSPFFTTDTGATLRAAEIGADAVLKATQVDGVYSADPKKDPSAIRYTKISLDEALAKGLQVMDTAALALARDNALPIVVFSIHQPGALGAVVAGEDVGSRITP